MDETRLEGDGTTSGVGRRARTRLLSVELLRVLALLGIATFHTFQPWFEMLVDGSLPEVYPALGGMWPPALLATMGFIDQLGAWGNHVFIMISGCFLLPRAQETLLEDGGSSRLWRQTWRRAAGVAFTVVFYSAITLVVERRFPDVTWVGIQNLDWFAQGLQFVWVYLLLVLACPVIASVLSRCRHQEVLLAALVLVVFGINAYIAFVSPGGQVRGLLEWRKLMSGVTYALSFVVGGWLGQRAGEARRQRGRAVCLLAAAILATIVAEAYAAARSDFALLDALSFKSTSVFAFLMAAASLDLVLAMPQGPAGGRPRLRGVVAFLTSGMLGFYVMQALFSRGWHQVSNTLLEGALTLGPTAFLGAGIAFSTMFFLMLVLVDALVRQPLARRLLP